MAELDAKLASYSHRLRFLPGALQDGAGASMAMEFLELLIFGYVSPELEHFLVQVV